MDVQTMQARLRTRFRDPNQDVVDDTEWLEFLNEAYEDVLAASPHWPFASDSATLVVNANARSVSLGADNFRVLSVHNATDDVKMQQLIGQPLLYFRDDSTGVPEWYRIFNQSLEVYPRPTVNTSFTVEFKENVPRLALATDEPVFPERFHHALLEGALSRAYEDVGNLEMSERHGARMLGILEQMKNDLLDTQGESYPQINDVWY